MHRLYYIIPMSLFLTGCLSQSDTPIQRPPDQGFGGEERFDDTARLPDMNHTFTQITVKGDSSQTVTMTVNSKADSDADPLLFSTDLPLDGNTLAVDPGFGNGSVNYNLDINLRFGISGETSLFYEIDLEN